MELSAWVTNDGDGASVQVMELDYTGAWNGKPAQLDVTTESTDNAIEWAELRLHEHGYSRVGEWAAVDFGWTGTVKKL